MSTISTMSDIQNIHFIPSKRQRLDNINTHNTIISTPRRKTSLIDLPEPILEQIVTLFAFGDRQQNRRQPGFPKHILPLASTCKTLRRLVAIIALTDDSYWNMYSPVEKDKVMECPHLSEDINTPISVPPRDLCYYKPCAIVHRLVAWYSLAAPGLKSFTCWRMFWDFPAREVCYLIKRFIAEGVTLRELRIRNPHSFKQHPFIYAPIFVRTTLIRAPRSFNAQGKTHMIDVLKNLLTVVAPTLQHLETDIENPIMTEVFREHKFPALQSFTPLLEDGDYDRQFEIIRQLLAHFSESGARIQQLRLESQKGQLKGFLPSFCSVSPHLQTIELVADDGKFQFPAAEEMKSFKVKKWKLECPLIKEEQMLNFAEYVVNNDQVTEIEYNYGNMLSLNTALRVYKGDFGEKITELRWCLEDYDYEFLSTEVAYFCSNLRELEIKCHTDEVSRLKAILENSKHLKVLRLINPDERRSARGFVRQLLHGLKKCHSPIEQFSLEVYTANASQICEILDRFGATLTDVHIRVHITSVDKLRPLQIVRDVLKHVLVSKKMMELKTLKLFSGFCARAVANHEGYLLATEITELLVQMEIHFPHFDGSVIGDELTGEGWETYLRRARKVTKRKL